jgi:hypothetical protein
MSVSRRCLRVSMPGRMAHDADSRRSCRVVRCVHSTSSAAASTCAGLLATVRGPAAGCLAAAPACGARVSRLGSSQRDCIQHAQPQPGLATTLRNVQDIVPASLPGSLASAQAATGSICSASSASSRPPHSRPAATTAAGSSSASAVACGHVSARRITSTGQDLRHHQAFALARCGTHVPLRD